MSFPEFGEIVENAPQLAEAGTYPEYGDVIEPVSRARSMANAAAKGLIQFGEQYPLMPSFGPVPSKLGHRMMEKFLPSEEKLPEELIEEQLPVNQAIYIL